MKTRIQCEHVETLIEENSKKETDFADVTDRIIHLAGTDLVFCMCPSCRTLLKSEILKW